MYLDKETKQNAYRVLKYRTKQTHRPHKVYIYVIGHIRKEKETSRRDNRKSVCVETESSCLEWFFTWLGTVDGVSYMYRPLTDGASTCSVAVATKETREDIPNVIMARKLTAFLTLHYSKRLHQTI